jgi:hypothetical protein
MDFPKSLARERIKNKGKKFPVNLVIWGVILIILLFLAKGTSILNPSTTNIFNPRIVPNSSVTYHDNSIIRTTEGTVEYPSSLGSTNQKDRLVRILSLNGDQTYYRFNSGDQLVEHTRFTNEFSHIKYITGSNYSFVTNEGLYLKTDATEYPELVYAFKIGELMYDYFYDSSEQSFYLATLLNNDTKISRVGSFGVQELYTLTGITALANITWVENSMVYIKYPNDICLAVNTTDKLQIDINCTLMKQNLVGINYYLSGNTVREFNIATFGDKAIFQENNITLQRVIQHDDTYLVSYINNIVNTFRNDYLYIPSLQKTVQLPDNFNISDFYLVGSIVYITDGKTLLGLDSSVPVSSTVNSWVTVIDRSKAISVELVY